jgi:hypothetical protein
MDGFVLDTAVVFILAIVTVFVGAALGTAAYRAYEVIPRRGPVGGIRSGGEADAVEPFPLCCISCAGDEWNRPTRQFVPKAARLKLPGGL